MSVVLLNAGVEEVIAFTSLEDGIRNGEISLDAKIQYFPWTEQQFVRVKDLPQLQKACASPIACFSNHIRQFSFPFCTVWLVFTLLCCAVLQAAINWDLQDWWFVNGVVGWENTIYNGQWWTIWTSQMLHFNAKHVLLNVLVIAYCGYQVERALGKMAMLNILIGGIFFGGVAICFLSPYPVAGSSLAAFSLWGAQIGIGFRLSDEIPYSFRFQYGWINVTLFVPLIIATLFLPNVSHLGHVVCFVSGIFIALFTPAGVFLPVPKKTMLLWVFGGWIIGGLSIGQVWRFPKVASFPLQHIELKEGLTFDIPSRMIYGHAYDMHAWKVASTGRFNSILFAGVFPLVEERDLKSTGRLDFWERQFERPVVPGSSISESIPVGWEGERYNVVEEGIEIVELTKRKGFMLHRIGCLQVAEQPQWIRHCLTWLQSVKDVDPVSLYRARKVYDSNDGDHEKINLAKEFERTGAFEKADALYAQIRKAEQGVSVTAFIARIRIRERHPSFIKAKDAIWLYQDIGWAPLSDGENHLSVIRWLIDMEDCEKAKNIFQHYKDSLENTSKYDDILSVMKRCQ